MKLRLILFLAAISLACPTEDFCRQCDFKSSKCLWCDQVVLTDKGRCDEGHKSVDHCEKNSAQDASICEICEIGFGVAKDQKGCVQCAQPKCGKCNVDQTKCESCRAGSILNSDKGTCVDDPLVIENCEVNQSTVNDKIPICLICKDGFALQGDKCVKPPIEHCVQFTDKVCEVCKKGFYIHADGDCLLHKTRKPTDKKSTFWWILLLLLLIAGGAGAYWYFKIRPQSNSESLI